MTYIGHIAGLLILSLLHDSSQAPHRGSGRREQDIVVYKPRDNVIGPAFGSSFYGDQAIHNAPAAAGRRSIPDLLDESKFALPLPPPPPPPSLGDFQLPEVPAAPTRRDADTYFNNPVSNAMLGQQFYGGNSVHNAKVAFASGSLPDSFRRSSDTYYDSPVSNALLGQQFYSGNSQHNANLFLDAPPVPDSFRRSSDTYFDSPVSNALLGQQFYSGNSQHNANLLLDAPPVLDFPVRRQADTYIENPVSLGLFGQQFYAGNSAHNADISFASPVLEAPTRRDADTYIMNPVSNAMLGQQFYSGNAVHNAQMGFGGFPGRRQQDIIVYQPLDNVIGPAYGQSFYGDQEIYNAPALLASRRNRG